MRSRPLLLAGLLTLGALANLAQATPEFGSELTIGSVNQDNQYDSFSNGQGLVVIVHTVDTSGIMVVEVSSNDGATWTTKSTGIAGFEPRVAAASTANIVIVSLNAAATGNAAATQVTRTSDGSTWTNSGSTPFTAGTRGTHRADLDYKDGKYVAVAYKCNSFFNFACGAENPTYPDWEYQWSASVDGGATWSAPANVFAVPDGAFNNGQQQAGMAIAMQSNTTWEVFSYRSVGGTNAWGIRRDVTTTSGASYTGQTVNDQFSPLSTASPGFGADIQVSDDGDTINFKAGSTLYSGQNIAGDLWSFTQIDTVVQGFLSPAFSCGNDAVVVYQGTSGDDRVSFAEISGGIATSTNVTGATAASANPYAAYRSGGDNITVVYGNLSTGKTSLKATTSSPCAQPLEADAAATFSNLLGFDVDGTGTTFIAKDLEASPKLEIYSASNLVAGATRTGVGCAQLWGVAALREAIAHYYCGSGSTVQSINFTSPSFTKPSTAPSACDFPADFTLDEDEFSNVFVDLAEGYELEEIHSMPFDYSVTSSGCSPIVSIAFTTLQGDFGVAYARFLNGVLFGSDVAAIKLDPSSGPTINQLCTSFDTINQRTFVGAASDNGVLIAQVNFDVANDEVTLTPVFSNSGTLGGANTLACAQDRAVAISNAAYRINLTSAQIEGAAIPASGQLHAAAYSLDGKWFSVLTEAGDELAIYNTNGTTPGSIGAPAGTYRDQRLDSVAQRIWACTTTRCETTPIGGLTGSTGSGFGSPYEQDSDADCIPDYLDPEPLVRDPTGCSEELPEEQDECGGGIFCPSGTSVPTGFTLSSFQFLLGVLFMLAVAGGTYFALGQTPIAAGIGAGGGFMGAFAFGLFPLWAVLLVALACAAVFVLKFKSTG